MTPTGERLPHSYTNDTVRDGGLVVKRYEGPKAEERCAREAAVLRGLAGLAGRVPVPPLVSEHRDTITSVFVDGVHGQDLIAAGLAGPVLRSCGAMLRSIHALDVVAALGYGEGGSSQGAVLVHGDYGPNNTMFTADGTSVAAVVDWEWAHLGAPIEDLAWCEWIVRMHHPGEVGALAGFFDAYGERPAWSARRRAMAERCRELMDTWDAWEPGGWVVRRWRDRLEATESWVE